MSLAVRRCSPSNHRLFQYSLHSCSERLLMEAAPKKHQDLASARDAVVESDSFWSCLRASAKTRRSCSERSRGTRHHPRPLRLAWQGRHPCDAQPARSQSARQDRSLHLSPEIVFPELQRDAQPFPGPFLNVTRRCSSAHRRQQRSNLSYRCRPPQPEVATDQ